MSTELEHEPTEVYIKSNMNSKVANSLKNTFSKTVGPAPVTLKILTTLVKTIPQPGTMDVSNFSVS